MKLFLLMFGLVPRFNIKNTNNKNKSKHKLYYTNELQHYPMNMFEDEDIFLKFKPYFRNGSGFDARFHGNVDDENENKNELYNITRLFYIYNVLSKLQSNIHDSNKAELIQEYEKYSTDTSFIPDITAGGLFDDWNNEFTL